MEFEDVEGEVLEAPTPTQIENEDEASTEKRKMTLSTLILLFPGLLLTIMVCWSSGLEIAGLGILLFVFQAILIKNFVEDRYK